MKKILVISSFVLVTACSQTDWGATMTAACISDGAGTAEQCSCFTNEARTRLSPEVFERFARDASKSSSSESAAERNADRDAVEFMEALNPQELAQVIGLVTEGTATCGI